MDQTKIFLEYEKEVAEFKLQLIRRLSKAGGPAEVKRDPRMSQAAIVENVLRSAGKPLHISEIIRVAEKDLGMLLDRDSLSSALAKQIRKGKRFVRTGRNTFGLRQT